MVEKVALGQGFPWIFPSARVSIISAEPHIRIHLPGEKNMAKPGNLPKRTALVGKRGALDGQVLSLFSAPIHFYHDAVFP
jgi:hypothetical protein